MQLFNLIKHKAFPYGSLADIWLQTVKSDIDTKASAPGAREGAYLDLAVAALKREYDHLAVEKEMRLSALELKPREDAARFAMPYNAALVIEVG